MILKASDDPTAKQSAKLDVNDEIMELEKDLAFLDFVQSEDFDNIEQFVAVSYSFVWLLNGLEQVSVSFYLYVLLILKLGLAVT